MQRLAARLTYANVMSTIAVFLALGGVAWASTQLPTNSVGTTQLRKNAVTGAKVKDGSLTAADLKPGTLQAGPAGPAGATGPSGPAGLKGDQGPSGIGPAYTTVRTASPLLSLGTSMTAVVTSPTLPAGSYVVNARANLLGGGATSSILCSIGDDAVQALPLATTEEIPLAMSSTVTLTSPGTVSLGCYKAGGTPQVAQASVIATRVTAVNPS